MHNLDRSRYEKIRTDVDESPFLYRLQNVCTPDHVFNLRWHEEMEIKYILSGKMNISCGTEIVCAQEGDVVISNPCEYHGNQVDKDECAEYHFVCIDINRIFGDNDLTEHWKKYVSGSYQFKNLIRNDREVKKLVKMLFASFQDHRDLLYSTGLFYMLFASLQKHIDKEQKRITRNEYSLRQKNVIDTAFAYIQNHYHETIRLEDIASQCFLTEAHFCRLFKQLTGETPIYYINKFRINKAVSYLAESQYTIKEIAEKVGFYDEAYFCRCFRKYKGVPPSRYIAHQIEQSNQ